MMNSPANLTCEYLTNPLGIEVHNPRLGWELRDQRRGAKQTAWQVVAAASREQLESGALWDSGKVVSDQSIHVAYQGPAAKSGQRVWWRVRTWDAEGQASAWSEAAWWEMGLLDRGEWTGQWIGAPLAGGKQTAAPVPFLRKAFSVGKGIRSARLYATAMGIYEMRLNGQSVGTSR